MRLHNLYLCRMRNKVIYIFVFVFFMVGCSKMIRIDQLNMAHIYNQQADIINPSYYVSHLDYQNSQLNIRIPSKELLYRKKDRENFFIANFQINIRVFGSFDKKGLQNNIVQLFSDTIFSDQEHIIHREIVFPLLMDGEYYIYINFTDLNQRVSQEDVLWTKKSSPFDTGFFTITTESDSDIQFNSNSAPDSEEISIKHNLNKFFTMEVNRFQPSLDFPSAPYVIDNSTPTLTDFVPDTTFRVAFTNGLAQLELPGYGVFRFSEPGNLSNGFTIRRFWKQFPYLPEDEAVLYPLRYLTSSNEFNALFALGDYRLANERFWARIAGNPDRGNALMNRYHNRVVKANKYFSSYLPGWQTDMGMIYILFGPPDMVFLNEGQENWYYTENLHTPAVEFIFILQDNILTENDYILQRNQSYRRNWNLAVDRWRR
jgi:GWxTD domain-containing protein